jgi:hypothetical protein
MIVGTMFHPKLGWFLEGALDAVFDEARIAKQMSLSRRRAHTYVILKTDGTRSLEICGMEYANKYGLGELMLCMKFINGGRQSFELLQYPGMTRLAFTTSLTIEWLLSFFGNHDIGKVVVDMTIRYTSSPRLGFFGRLRDIFMGERVEKVNVLHRTSLDIYLNVMRDRSRKYEIHRELIEKMWSPAMHHNCLSVQEIREMAEDGITWYAATSTQPGHGQRILLS